MNRFTSFQANPRRFLLAAAAIPAVFAIATSGVAQQGSSPDQEQAAGQHSSGPDAPPLAHQIHELQAKVARLEAALKQAHQGQGAPPTGSMDTDSMKTAPAMPGMENGSMKMGGMKKGMGDDATGMDKMGGMAGMNKMGGGMGSMGMTSDQSASGGMGMMGGGMKMMGKMKGMGKMRMPSSLPGYPGASHIYHIGATNFFLDHDEHITLTGEQQSALNRTKEKSLLEQATFDRKIAEAEQELWVLTSGDTPDAAAIETKVRDIERLGGDKRIAFIRAVGRAAGELTKEQRMMLVGMLPPEHKATTGGAESP